MTGYTAWMERHAKIFGLLEPKHVEQMTAWQAIFDAQGVTAEQLTQATDQIAKNTNQPRYANEHLAAIQTALRSIRSIDTDTGEVDTYRCDDCHGTGRIEVPHPRCLAAGEWRPLRLTRSSEGFPYTCAVRCHCHRGRTGRFATKRADLMPLADYERINPRWRQQMAGHSQAKRLASANLPRTSFDDIVDRLRSQQRQPGDDPDEEADANEIDF